MEGVFPKTELFIEGGLRGEKGTLQLFKLGKTDAEVTSEINSRERGKGFGTSLLKAAEEKARELGLRRIYAKTHKDNSRGKGSLLKAGWKFCATQDELLVFEKIL